MLDKLVSERYFPRLALCATFRRESQSLGLDLAGSAPITRQARRLHAFHDSMVPVEAWQTVNPIAR